MLCRVDTMIHHPVFKARLELLIDEYQGDTADNQEWIEWVKKYRAWNAETLDSYGVRRDGQNAFVILGHPVLDLIRANLDNLAMSVTEDAWQKIDCDLFDSCCQTLRLRFYFLKQIPKLLL